MQQKENEEVKSKLRDLAGKLKNQNISHFMPLVSLYTCWKHQKTSIFVRFLRGIEKEQCHEMDYVSSENIRTP